MNHTFEIIPLTIEARGEIITNNLPEFRELVREALGNINRDLKTDEEFGQAELDVKALKGAEDTVRAAALKAFDEKLKELVDGLNETAEEIRTPRLELEKLIAKRKDEVKGEIIEEYLASFDIDASLARKTYLSGLKCVIKGKRTLESMRTACRVFATTQQGLITKCRQILDSFDKAHGSDLIPDRRDLELEKPEGLEAELRRRFEAKRAREEKKLLEEEAAKAKAEAAAAIKQAEEAARPPAPPANVLPMNQAPAPPKIGSIPVGAAAKQGPTADEEWEAFKMAVFTSFGPLKSAKESLRHLGNVARAAKFAQAVNAAWQEANAKEVAQ